MQRDDPKGTNRQASCRDLGYSSMVRRDSCGINDDTFVNCLGVYLRYYSLAS